ncbi:TPA: hypothetical protein NH194_004287 [Pseudomonas aeruginosa]|nr:hypothetical protein [Pseudomonas aeruginosa]HCE9512040.1 hypothetical protein [Pseudomonas aeruginosa]
MNANTKAIYELCRVIKEQQELLRLALWVMSQGPTVFRDQEIKCVLKWDQVRAASATCLGAGQSLNTILKSSEERGIPVRDLYPVARSVVEGFINAAFFITQPVDIAQRALKHKDYAAWRHTNRVVGTGKFTFSLSSCSDPQEAAARLFPEFSGKGRGSWSTLDAPSKIDRIGRSVQSSGGALLGAYGLIYAISSEIIHGSVYGMSYFMSAHNPGDMTVEGFQNGTESQVVTILTAVSHAASGFLSAFWQLHQCRPAIDAERSLFERILKAVQCGDVAPAAPSPEDGA